MTDDDYALKLVFTRNSFYRQQYFFALGAFFLSAVVVVCLFMIMLFLKHNPVKPVYFATDSVGRLMQVVPVSETNMTIDEVMSWVTEAVEKTYSYDFVNFRAEMQNSQKYFTEYGWKDYLRALIASNNLVALRARSMVVVAHVINKPTLVTQGLLGGAYAYKFTLPVLVTYMLPPYDDKSRFSNALTVSVVIQRQSILQSYKGWGILQILATFNQKGSAQPNELTDTPSG